MSDPIEILSASDNPVEVILKREAAQGPQGDPGQNGFGFNSVRKEIVDNPILSILRKNKLTETIAPNNQDSDLSTLRATTKLFTNRYGLLETAAINELPEGINGYPIERAATNFILQSESFLTSPWLQSIYNGGALNYWSATANSTDITDIYGTNLATKMVVSVANSLFARQAGLNISAGNVAASIYVYIPDQAGVSSVWVGSIFDGVESQTTEITKFNEWVRVENVTDLAALRDEIDYFIRPNNMPPTAGFEFYAMACQCERNGPTSYIKTTSSTDSRAADDVTAPALNNMMNLVKPWSLVLRFDQSLQQQSDVVNIICFDELSTQFASTCLVKEPSGQYLFRYSDGTNTDDVRFNLTETFITLCIVFDGSNIRVYQDAALIQTYNSVTAKPIAKTDSKIFIGRAFGNLSFNYSSTYSDIAIYDTNLNNFEISYLS